MRGDDARIRAADDGELVVGERVGHRGSVGRRDGVGRARRARHLATRGGASRTSHGARVDLVSRDETDRGRRGDALATGGQDGAVRLRDPRGDPRASPIASVPAHVSGDVPGAAGAVGDIDQTADGRVVSVGADGKLAVLDPRRGFDVVAKIPLGDFAYSLAVAGTLALAGTGSGHVHVVDVAGETREGCRKHSTRWAPTKARRAPSSPSRTRSPPPGTTDASRRTDLRGDGTRFEPTRVGM